MTGYLLPYLYQFHILICLSHFVNAILKYLSPTFCPLHPELALVKARANRPSADSRTER